MPLISCRVDPRKSSDGTTRATASKQAVTASPAPQPTWRGRCTDAGGITNVEFRSASGDVTEDDMRVSIAWAAETRPAPIAPGWFKATDFTSNEVSRCQGLGGFSASDGRLLFWVRRDGRPGPDHLAVILVSPEKRVVLDALSDLGEIAGDGEHPLVVRREGYFEA